MNDDQIIERALEILAARIAPAGEALTSPNAVGQYLRLRIGSLEHEVFAVILLDTRHRVITMEEMFRGTIDGASVYPREVVKAALVANAAAAIFAHNHPSGVATPSSADERITARLIKALDLIDVRVLDHVVVTATDSFSFAEHGMI